MNTATKKAGRPVGSSRHAAQDAALLKRVAALMVEHDITKTAAIKRLIGAEDPSGLHRLQGKFKEKSEVLIAAARTVWNDRREKERHAKQLSVTQKWAEAEAIWAKYSSLPENDFLKRAAAAQKDLGVWGKFHRALAEGLVPISNFDEY